MRDDLDELRRLLGGDDARLGADDPFRDWSTRDVSPELRVGTRRGFRVATVPMGDNHWLVCVVPDYPTNARDALSGQASAGTFGALGGSDEMLPRAMLESGGRLLKELTPQAVRPALRRVVRAVYAGCLREPIYGAAPYTWDRMPQGVRADRRTIAKRAFPAALEGAMREALPEVLPLVAARGALGILVAALPAAIAQRVAVGQPVADLVRLQAILPAAAQALPPQSLSSSLQAQVQRELEPQMRAAVPRAVEMTVRERVPRYVQTPFVPFNQR